MVMKGLEEDKLTKEIAEHEEDISLLNGDATAVTWRAIAEANEEIGVLKEANEQFGVQNMKLKKKLAKPAHKGINPCTKEPCGFKAKLASKTAYVLPMKKLKEAIT